MLYASFFFSTQVIRKQTGIHPTWLTQLLSNLRSRILENLDWSWIHTACVNVSTSFLRLMLSTCHCSFCSLMHIEICKKAILQGCNSAFNFSNEDIGILFVLMLKFKCIENFHVIIKVKSSMHLYMLVRHHAFACVFISSQECLFSSSKHLHNLPLKLYYIASTSCYRLSAIM